VIRGLWHVGWSATVIGSLTLWVVRPIPGFEDWRVWAAGMIAYPVAGALLLIRRPGNRVGMVLATVAAASGVVFIGGWLVFQAIDEPWTMILEIASSAAVVVMFWGAISLLHLFPTGSAPTPGLRRFFVGFTALMALMALVGVVTPVELVMSGRPNPLGGPNWVETLWNIGIWALPLGVVGGLWSVRVRRRRASPVERSQLRWFAAGGGALVLLVVIIGFVPELPAPYESLLFPVVVVGFWALPAAVVVAILRYRLYEIDRLVSRSVTYAVVVGVVAVVYVVAVGVLSRVVPGEGDLAVAGSTLAVAAVFSPVRRRVQGWVDRRFNRSRFDAGREVEAFSGRLGREVDLGVVESDLLGVVERTLQPSAAGLWIREEARWDA
jgi:hypothetical protein